MLKILVSDNLSEKGLGIFKSQSDFSVDVNTKLTPDELRAAIKDYDALIIRSGTKVTRDIIEAADKLKVIGRAGVGIDNVDVEAASKKGIIVMNTPGGNTIATAEHTMSLILACARNIPQADASLREGKWDRKTYRGVELYNKTLGIIGVGRIGTEVAKRARAFDMKIIAYDPFLSPERAMQLDIQLADLDEVLSTADFITVHTPLTDDTKHLLNESAFKKMKKGVRIINCARGGIVDEAALLAAIEEGKVAGAAFDVYEKEPPGDLPIIRSSKVVTTPHLGAATEEAQDTVAVEVAYQVVDALLDKGIRNAVNFPSVSGEVMKKIGPYFELAEKLGGLLGQLIDADIKEVKIKYQGEVTAYELSPLTIAVLRGLMLPVLQETVNYVNASVIAKERGIKVIEVKTDEVEEFANMIFVEVTAGKQTMNAMGSLYADRKPRIVKIDGYYVDVVPSGYMIVIRNLDKPGIVGQIGTILGKYGINIAGMTFGRETPGGEAITVLNVDGSVSQEAQQELGKAQHIKCLKVIKI
ncbi:MAG: phosphoglycerate dehydrogenase [Candidatus Omnitrophica bacterium]|nr:phosphoglycerate dehydrogenase [Candidatus Omnitrophota bacterium]